MKIATHQDVRIMITRRIVMVISALAVTVTACPISTVSPVYADEVESLTNGGTISRGEYRLENDITIPINVDKNNSVTIDLNGHSIVTEGTPIENRGYLEIVGKGKKKNHMELLQK